MSPLYVLSRTSLDVSVCCVCLCVFVGVEVTPAYSPPPLLSPLPHFPSLYVSPTNVAIDCFTAWLGKYWRRRKEKK